MWGELGDVPLVVGALDHLDVPLLGTAEDGLEDTATVRAAEGLIVGDDSDDDDLVDRVTTVGDDAESRELPGGAGFGREMVISSELGLDDDDFDDGPT